MAPTVASRSIATFNLYFKMVPLFHNCCSSHVTGIICQIRRVLPLSCPLMVRLQVEQVRFILTFNFTVFGIVECPAGCSSKLINTQQHTCGPLTQFNKTCLLTCPGAKKPVKAKCVVDKRTKRPKFTKLCKPQG